MFGGYTPRSRVTSRRFTQLQTRIEAVCDCVTDSLTRIFGEERPAFAALAEEELIEKLAGRVVARIESVPAAKKDIGNRYVRETEAATFLGVKVGTRRCWRSKVTESGSPVTSVGGMVMYSIKSLEQYVEQRIVEGR